MTLDDKNEAALRAIDQRMAPPEPKEQCNVCLGTGFVPDTETEHLFGDTCPEGCPPNVRMMRERDQN